VAQSEELI